MGEATNMYPIFNDQTFRPNKISENKDYAIAKVFERGLMS